MKIFTKWRAIFIALLVFLSPMSVAFSQTSNLCSASTEMYKKCVTNAENDFYTHDKAEVTQCLKFLTACGKHDLIINYVYKGSLTDIPMTHKYFSATALYQKMLKNRSKGVRCEFRRLAMNVLDSFLNCMLQGYRGLDPENPVAINKAQCGVGGGFPLELIYINSATKMYKYMNGLKDCKESHYTAPELKSFAFRHAFKTTKDAFLKEGGDPQIAAIQAQVRGVSSELRQFTSLAADLESGLNLAKTQLEINNDIFFNQIVDIYETIFGKITWEKHPEGKKEKISRAEIDLINDFHTEWTITNKKRMDQIEEELQKALSSVSPEKYWELRQKYSVDAALTIIAATLQYDERNFYMPDSSTYNIDNPPADNPARFWNVVKKVSEVEGIGSVARLNQITQIWRDTSSNVKCRPLRRPGGRIGKKPWWCKK